MGYEKNSWSSGDKITVTKMNNIENGIETVDTGKMDKANPTGTGSLSIGRDADSTVGVNSIALGIGVSATGAVSFAEGSDTSAEGIASHAEGYQTKVFGETKSTGSHAEGRWTRVFEVPGAHAEGSNTMASGNSAHAEGYATQASGPAAHAEGLGAEASSASSTSLYGIVASGRGAHAEGFGYKSTHDTADTANMVEAIGQGAHAEGSSTKAVSDSAHAEGKYTKANSNYSHAEGIYTIASSSAQHVQGKYNIEDTANIYADIVGNGSSDSARSNASALDWNGNLYLAGDVYVQGTNDDASGGTKLLAIPALPTTAGNYVLRAAVTIDGEGNPQATYSWVAES